MARAIGVALFLYASRVVGARWEVATPMGWKQYVGDQGVAIGIPHFGASAPAGVLYQEFGLTAQHMAEEASRLVTRSKV